MRCHRSSGRPGQRSTDASHGGARPAYGPGCTASSSTRSEPGASWTGRASLSTPSASVHSKGAADRTESDRPRQEGIENPPGRGPQRPARRGRHLGRQHARQPRAAATGRLDPAHPLPTRSPTTEACETPRGQGLRLPTPAAMAPETRRHTPHRPPQHRQLTATGPTPLGGRAHHALTRRLPPPAPTLRTKTRTLPRVHSHRHQPHQLPTTHQVKRLLTAVQWLPRATRTRMDRTDRRKFGSLPL